MDYELRPEPRKQGSKARIVPPRPKKGERAPLPYSKAERDSLRATVQQTMPKAMVTLKAPPAAAIVSWPVLLSCLIKLNGYLSNQYTRNHFPQCIAVTEFDPVEMEDTEVPAAAFHIGFAEPLTDVQQEAFQQWWLRLWNLPHNQGRHFQHDSQGGGQSLADYLAKDVAFRNKQPRPVKFRPSWMPERIEKRLWFCIGMKRCPAKQGRQLRASTRRILRRFEIDHGNPRKPRLKASTRESDSEHAQPLITSDAKTAAGALPRPVETSALEQVCAPELAPSPVIVKDHGTCCLKCWNRGRALWPTCCYCTGDVK